MFSAANNRHSKQIDQVVKLKELTAVTESQSTIRSRGRSVPGEYSRNHLVYRTEGSTDLVVLFVIIVVLVSVVNRINLHRWNPTWFILFFVAFNEVFLALGLAVFVLDCLLVLRKKRLAG